MFTIKLYSDDPSSPVPGYKQRILEAESFTILRGSDGSAEITLHNGAVSARYDVTNIDRDKPRESGWPDIYRKAIIENADGRTTEIISLRPMQKAA